MVDRHDAAHDPAQHGSADGAAARAERTSGAAGSPAWARRPVFDSDEIFRGADEVHIVHGEALYRLRRTSLGKLILTK